MRALGKAKIERDEGFGKAERDMRLFWLPSRHIAVLGLLTLSLTNKQEAHLLNIVDAALGQLIRTYQVRLTTRYPVITKVSKT